MFVNETNLIEIPLLEKVEAGGFTSPFNVKVVGFFYKLIYIVNIKESSLIFIIMIKQI